MNKSYHEIKTSVYLNNNIHSSDMYEKLSNFINFSFNNSQVLSCLHKSKGFKHYSFSGLYPIERDYVYKSDEIYSFLFRTHDKEVANEFVKSIMNLNNDDFITTEVSLKTWNYENIKHIDNLTPTVFTLNNGLRWNLNDGMEIAKERIFNNLMKKYNCFNNTSFSFGYNDMIDDIIIKNECPIVINYKGIKFLGYKFRVKFKENPIAQEIANFAVVDGIGEKSSSFGMGFVKPYFRRYKEC